MRPQQRRRIVVKFADPLALTVDDKGRVSFDGKSINADDLSDLRARWKKLTDGTPFRVSVLFNSVPSKTISQLQDIATERAAFAEDGEYKQEALRADVASGSRTRKEPYYRVNFGNFLAIGSAEFAATGEQFLEQARQVKLIDYAYWRLDDSDAAIDLTLPDGLSRLFDPLSPGQSFLREGPLGIGATKVTHEKGSDAKGLTFIDIERGWDSEHEAFRDAANTSRVFSHTPAAADNRAASAPHGTAVLGIVCADQNCGRAQGIAQGCNPEVASYWNQTQSQTKYWMTTGHVSLAETLIRVLGSHLQNLNGARPSQGRLRDPGMVMLIEAQTEIAAHPRYFFPVEFYPDVFHAIQLATAVGVTVIEPAGNGLIGGARGRPLAFDLDTLPPLIAPVSQSAFFKIKPNVFKDSGAIMVAGGTYHAPSSQGGSGWVRHPYSNFGSRIDCFAAGRGVASAGAWKQIPAPGNAVHQQYCADFNGTSAASAIIAGAALSLQGMRKAKSGNCLTPAALRQMMKSTTTGTSPLPPLPPAITGDKIGVMPDLCKIVSEWP